MVQSANGLGEIFRKTDAMFVSPYYKDRFWFTSDGDVVVANRPHELPEITMPCGDGPWNRIGVDDDRYRNHINALCAWISSE